MADVYDPLANAGKKPEQPKLPIRVVAANLMRRHEAACVALFDAYKGLQAGIHAHPDYTAEQIIGTFGALEFDRLYKGKALPDGKNEAQLMAELGGAVYKAFQRTAIVGKASLIAEKPGLIDDGVPSQPIADFIIQYLAGIGL